MWPRRGHILAPLTELCGSKRNFKWTDTHENAFLQAKQLVTEDVLLRFPDHSIPFEIFTDASNYHIRASVKQKNLPIAYFSKKLTPAQRKYSTIEQEMLAIVEVLKEYHNILLGANIIIFTDHKNLLSNSTVSNRVFRWKQKIEEFGPNIQCIKGQCNIEADALSRLPTDTTSAEIMLNHPPLDPENPILNKNPLDLELIQSHQSRNVPLQKVLIEDKYFTKTGVGNTHLIHYRDDRMDKPKIVIPHSIQYAAIRWMHSLLGHAGIS